MDVAHGGMPGPRTCMLLFLNPTLIVVVFCHCWNNADASSLLYEPPYTPPYVRWCGRTAEVTPPPTRSKKLAAIQRAATEGRPYSHPSNVYTDAAIAASKISRATSTFSFVSISGGDQRNVLEPAPRMINPRSKHP